MRVFVRWLGLLCGVVGVGGGHAVWWMGEMGRVWDVVRGVGWRVAWWGVLNGGWYCGGDWWGGDVARCGECVCGVECAGCRGVGGCRGVAGHGVGGEVVEGCGAGWLGVEWGVVGCVVGEAVVWGVDVCGEGGWCLCWLGGLGAGWWRWIGVLVGVWVGGFVGSVGRDVGWCGGVVCWGGDWVSEVCWGGCGACGGRWEFGWDGVCGSVGLGGFGLGVGLEFDVGVWVRWGWGV
ncbi:hypothetical protein Tco_1523526 [Tanacetum coccineum]